MGDPREQQTELGPLVSKDAVDTVDKQVRESLQKGAKCLTGGHKAERAGFFYVPTVLADIPEGCPAYDDEIFGPVASMFKVSQHSGDLLGLTCFVQIKDIDEAVWRANRTRYGLSSCVFTNDTQEQERFIKDIEAGMTFINGISTSEAQVPFGGVKQSGFGRELGDLGLYEFVNPKTVYVNRL